MYCNFANSDKITVPEVHSVSVLLPFKGFKEPNSSVQGQEESENQIFSLIKVQITICKFVHCSTNFNADMPYFNVYFVYSFIIILHTRC